MVGGMGKPNTTEHEMERKKYISKVGYLYPERDEKLRNVTDLRSLVMAVEATPYEKILSQVAMDNDRNEAESSEVTIDDAMLATAAQRYSLAFEGGFHMGCFFAYLKLKEQEIKNVTWLAELVQMNVNRNLPGWNKYIAPFQYHANDVLAKWKWERIYISDKLIRQNNHEYETVLTLYNVSWESIFLCV